MPETYCIVPVQYRHYILGTYLLYQSRWPILPAVDSPTTRGGQMKQPAVMVSELLTLYRIHPGDHMRREDGRHARWWVDELGALPASKLTTARILQAVEQLGADG